MPLPGGTVWVGDDAGTTLIFNDAVFKDLNGKTINLHTNLKGKLVLRGKGASSYYEFKENEKDISDDDLKALRKLSRVRRTLAKWKAARFVKRMRDFIVDIAGEKATGVALDMLESCPITGSDSNIIGGSDYAQTANSGRLVVRQRRTSRPARRNARSAGTLAAGPTGAQHGRNPGRTRPGRSQSVHSSVEAG